MSAPDPSPDRPDSNGQERELCRSCLAPNEPGAAFCRDCGAPLSSYAATGPFEHLFAEGHVYRSAVERPHKPIVLLGMWVVFGSVGVTGLILVLVGNDLGHRFEPFLGVFLVVVSAVLLWRTTRNYFKHRRAAASRDTSPRE